MSCWVVECLGLGLLAGSVVWLVVVKRTLARRYALLLVVSWAVQLCVVGLFSGCLFCGSVERLLFVFSLLFVDWFSCWLLLISVRGLLSVTVAELLGGSVPCMLHVSVVGLYWLQFVVRSVCELLHSWFAVCWAFQLRGCCCVQSEGRVHCSCVAVVFRVPSVVQLQIPSPSGWQAEFDTAGEHDSVCALQFSEENRAGWNNRFSFGA